MSSGMMANWQYPKISRRAFIGSLFAYSAFPSFQVSAKTDPTDSGTTDFSPTGSGITEFGSEDADSDVAPVVVRGPYLQRCHANGVVVMWYTNIPASTHVRFGTELGALDQSFTVGGQRRRHVARINGLLPETKYYYSIGTAAEVQSQGHSSKAEETYFITAPRIGKAKPTRIWALGDSGNVNNSSRAVRDSYYAASQEKHTDVFLMLGDNAYPNGTDSEYHEAVFEMYGDLLRKTPLWPAYGNHEARCTGCVSAQQVGPFFGLFKLPAGAQAGGFASTRYDFYSFDHGDIHFICLNSHDAFNSHMLHWLSEDLRQSRASWKIAYWHHPPYSKSIHDSDLIEQMRLMRTQFVPILEEYGVDLVLCGHNHNYERSAFLNGHYGNADTLTDSMILDAGDGDPKGDGPYTKKVGPFPGTVYVAAGCASALKSGPLDHPAMVVSAGIIGSVVIDIDNNLMDVRFLDKHGDTLDSFQIEKVPTAYFPLYMG